MISICSGNRKINVPLRLNTYGGCTATLDCLYVKFHAMTFWSSPCSVLGIPRVVSVLCCKSGNRCRFRCTRRVMLKAKKKTPNKLRFSYLSKFLILMECRYLFLPVNNFINLLTVFILLHRVPENVGWFTSVLPSWTAHILKKGEAKSEILAFFKI